MAIEKTYFTTYDLQPIADYISANATDYFDRVEISEDKLTIICYVGETDAFKITKTATGNGKLTFTFKTESGYTVSATPANNSGTTSTAANSRIRRITKTSCGIAIAVYSYSSISQNNSWYTANAPEALFITKDNNGNTAFVWDTLLMTGYPYNSGATASGYTESSHLTAINVKSEKQSVVTYNNADRKNNYALMKKDFVQLVRIDISDQGLCYLPNCFISYHSNVLGTECTLEHNGNKYVYNGFVALKE